MTAKEYLSQIRCLQIDINRLQSVKDRLISDACSIRSPVAGEKVQSSPDSDKLSTIISRVDSLTAGISAVQKQQRALRTRIRGQIYQLDDARYIDVLYKRHIELKSWKVIALEMRYTIRNVQYIHGYALAAFHDKFHDKFHEEYDDGQ